MSRHNSEDSRTCTHCGTGIPRTVEGEFCCTGCAYVHRMIQESGLEQYYDYRDRTIDPVGSRVFKDRDFEDLRRWQDTQEGHLDTEIVEGELSLQGISCVGCVWLVERIFQKQVGAVDIRIDAHTGRVRLSWQRSLFRIESLAQEAAQFGYVLGRSSAQRESSTRGLVTRLGLCAAFMMNAMLFTFPRYLGMEKDFLLADLFELLSILFASLSLLVGGSYFIQRAWKSLRVRVLHIDIPIALGLVLAFVGSVIGWVLRVDGLLYFDFISVFVFLMLGGRWVQEWYVERSRNQWVDSNALPEMAEAVDKESGDASRLPFEEITAGTQLLVTPGGIAPVASILDSDGAEMSLEWINGESVPVVYKKRARVPAGATNLSGETVKLRAEEPWGDSLLKRLTETRRGSVSRDPLMDRVLKNYLITVLSIAAISGILWSIFSAWVSGIQVAVSILVISCPCAIGVAWPLAIDRCVQVLRGSGVFIREPNIWRVLQKIKTIVFDKTGTLTLERPKLLNPDALDKLSANHRGVLSGLVRQNLHPIARSLREQLTDSNAANQILDHYTEIPGKGVTCEVDGTQYFLGKSDGLEPGTLFQKDGATLAVFQFADEVRHDATRALRLLGKRGLNLEILSGDSSDKVEGMRQKLDCNSVTHAEGEMSPEAKARRIQNIGSEETLMIGDGVNDSLAFETAALQGTPLVDRSLLVERAAFYFSGQGLDGIIALFRVSDALAAAGKAMFSFAVFYNAIALGICLFGAMNPLGAAILMPISSILTILVTLTVLNKRLRETADTFD
ncbi:MAG: heavy metal translocating P-type ATPase metal-binding domain-containing protein [Opitutales bacterium]